MYCHKCGNILKEGASFCDKCGSSTNTAPMVSQTTTVPQAQTPVQPPTQEQLVLPASIWQRFGNSIIDRIFLYILLFIIGLGIGLINSSDSSTVWIWVAMIIIFCGYDIFCESIWQRTVGKLITQTKVVDRQGNKPSFMRIVGRSLARLIPFDWVSFLLNGHPIGWHDAVSGTRVVPSSMTPEEASKIDPERIRQSGSHNVAVIIIIGILGFFMFVAVIGILSAVVLASLNTARQKGNDAMIKSNMSIVETQSALYFDMQNNSYAGFCTDQTALSALMSASQAGTKDKGTNSYVCNDSKTAWAASVPLPEGSYWCVDSKNTYGTISSPLTTETACPPLSSSNLTPN